jgi:hypothetical protein
LLSVGQAIDEARGSVFQLRQVSNHHHGAPIYMLFKAHGTYSTTNRVALRVELVVITLGEELAQVQPSGQGRSPERRVTRGGFGV